MYPPAHIGVGLLVSSPSTVVLERNPSLRFTLVVLVGARLPDVDTMLPIQHHGVTHTLLFVSLGSVGFGAATAVLVALSRTTSSSTAGDPTSASRSFVTGVTGGFLGGLSHLVLDMISAPTEAEPAPIDPLWPFRGGWVTRELIPVRSAAWSYGLLVAGLVTFGALYLATHGRAVTCRFQNRLDQ